MRFFDPHIHMFSRTTDDYEAMAKAGVVGVCEPAFWLGQPRTQVGTFIDYFNTLIGWEPFRASQFGIKHYCTMGLNPKEANNVPLAEEVMKILPKFAAKENVVAFGELGFDDVTDAEERFLIQQLEMAGKMELPVMVHLPHRDKLAGLKRTIDVVRKVGIPDHMVILDHLNEQTLPLAKDECECWYGHSIYPNTKMTEERMVALLQKFGTERIMVNSAADWGVSDPLKVPKTAKAMLDAGFSEADVDLVLFQNPINFYAQSGKISVEEVASSASVDQTALWEENSVLRGQQPRVDEK